jgi:hypothetical protein
MKITIPTFRGMRPKAAPHLLEDSEAQVARNTDIQSGMLRALPAAVTTIVLDETTVLALSRWTENTSNHWVALAADADFVRHPMTDDAFERFFFTGSSEPRFFANDLVSDPFDPTTDYIKLGVPAPTAALSASGYTTGNEYRAWVYTFVNRYGDESAPSPLLEKEDYGSGNVTLSGFSAPAADHALTLIRIYRVNASGADFAQFQLVFPTDIKIYSADDTYASGDYVVYNGGLFKCVTNGTKGVTPVGSASQWDDQTDNVDDADMQPDTLVSESWEPPPSGLTGLVALPNGILAGFSGRVVYLSEPYYPHAWPREYSIPMPENVIGLAVLGSGLLVMTEGHTHLISGTSPDLMSPRQLPGFYPCISKRSIAVSDDGILYASRPGLIHADFDGCVNATAEIISETDWQAYYPSGLHGCFHDGRYFGFSSTLGGILIDFVNKGFTLVDTRAYATYLSTDAVLYIVVAETVDPDNPPEVRAMQVQEWAADDINSLYYTWRSKRFLAPAELNFAAARVLIDSDFFDAIMALAVENEIIEDYNAVIFDAGDFGGGLGAAGLNVFGLNADKLRTEADLSTGSTVTFKYYVGGVLKFTKIVDSKHPFRLPSGFRGYQFEMSLEGYLPVRALELATSVEELFSA